MSILNSVKLNVPQVSLENYFWVISGIPKAGKTTLFANLVKKHFGSTDVGLLLAFEKGYQALDVNAVDITDWDMLEELVDELISTKDNHKFRFIGLDTADVMYEMAQDSVVREWNRKNPSKRTTDIGGVGAKGNSDNGFGVGYVYLKQKVRKVLDKLMKAGFGIMAITHSKDKTIEQHDGQKFDQLTLSLPNAAREIFVNGADFIVFITVEKEKARNGEVVTNRYMYFRTDGYIEAGSRFTNVPDKIDYSVDGLLQVFENAVKSSVGDNVDIETLAKEQATTNQAKAQKYIETTKNDGVENLRSQIQSKIENMTKEQKKALAGMFNQKFDSAKFTDYEDVEQLKSALEMATQVLNG